MKKRFDLKRWVGVLYALIIALLSVLFFTNDFGLVDLRKTSVIIGVGVDIVENDEIKLTAQLAVPQPAENGENTKYASVTGQGKTVACALNEVNVKTGFYPKLVFCKMIILGESCLNKNTNEILNYFYYNEYVDLSPKIAACKGAAEELLSLTLPYGGSVTDFVERLLSEEAEKSGNVSTVDMNEFGQGYFKVSGAAYMPYITCIKKQEGQSGGTQSEGAQSGGEQGDAVEFICNRTAVFEKGVCKGVLDDKQSFALNALKHEIRHAYSQCGGGGRRTVLGMRNCKGGASLKVEKGVPTLTLKFSAVAKQIDNSSSDQAKTREREVTPKEALKDGEEQIKKQLKSLFDFVKDTGCDVIGAKDMLHKKNYKYYDTFKDILYDKIELVLDVKLKSAS